MMTKQGPFLRYFAASSLKGNFYFHFDNRTSPRLQLVVRHFERGRRYSTLCLHCPPVARYPPDSHAFLYCDRDSASLTVVTPYTTIATMSEEKVRLSGENARPADSPILPTVNPNIEKQEPKKGNGIPPAVYVMSVPSTAPHKIWQPANALRLIESGSPSPPVLFCSTNGFYLP